MERPRCGPTMLPASSASVARLRPATSAHAGAASQPKERRGATVRGGMVNGFIGASSLAHAQVPHDDSDSIIRHFALEVLVNRFEPRLRWIRQSRDRFGCFGDAAVSG